MNKRLVAVFAAGLVLGGLVIGAVLAATGGDGDDSAGPEATTTTAAPLSETAQEFLDRIEKGRDIELHLVLEQVGDTSAGKVRLEVWRKGGQVAQSVVTTVQAEGQEARSEMAAFKIASGTTVCTRSTGKEWLCQKSATVADDASDVFQSASRDLAGKKVTATDRSVAGFPSRCYTITEATGTSEFCVTEEGIPVRLGFGSSIVELVTIERTVNDDVFVPPAGIAPSAG